MPLQQTLAFWNEQLEAAGLFEEAEATPEETPEVTAEPTAEGTVEPTVEGTEEAMDEGDTGN